MRPFEPADLAALNAWYQARGLPEVPLDALPFGLVEPGIAAGFAYLTGTSVALIDGLIACPSAPLRARHRAIKGIVSALASYCRDQGAPHVIGFTREPGTERLARRLGFAEAGTYRLMRKEW